LRDRRKDEANEAREFISRLEVIRKDAPHRAPAWSGQVYATNIGRSPIYDVALYFPTLSISERPAGGRTFRRSWAFIRPGRPGTGRIQSLQLKAARRHDARLGYGIAVMPKSTEVMGDVRSVMPGQSISVTADVADRDLLDGRGWLLRFTDSHGRRWYCEFGESRFVSRRKAHRILRPLMGVELRFTVHNRPGPGRAVS
jgi:hypothetical protein